MMICHAARGSNYASTTPGSYNPLVGLRVVLLRMFSWYYQGILESQYYILNFDIYIYCNAMCFDETTEVSGNECL